MANGSAYVGVSGTGGIDREGAFRMGDGRDEFEIVQNLEEGIVRIDV